jgi:hypothetical protein
MIFRFSVLDRLHAGAIHLAISLVVTTVCAILVFFLWYPYPYREISGGRELFFIITLVDVVLGPCLTLAIFDKKKTRLVLARDLAAIGLIQLAALGYGLWTVSMARPVHLVFEIDRFRVIHAADVDMALLQKATKELRNLPFSGPTLVGVRPFKDEEERVEATIAALNGISLGSRPDLWQAYADSRADVLKVAHRTEELLLRFPAKASSIERALKAMGRSSQNTLYLPLAGRKSFWTVFLDPLTAEVVAVLPVDSF